MSRIDHFFDPKSPSPGNPLNTDDESFADLEGSLDGVNLRFVLVLQRLMLRERQLRKDLEVSNREKDLILSVLSHELRTPLSSILLWAQILQTGMADPDKQQQCIDGIIEGARSQNEVVNELVDGARVALGLKPLHLQSVTLADVLDNAIQRLGRAAQRRGVHLNSAHFKEPLEILADPNRVGQVFQGLLNYLIATSHFGADLRIDCVPVKQSSQDLVQIRMSGSDTLVDSNARAHLADLLSQPSDEIAPSRQVLNLAIAGDLVALQGGSLKLERDPSAMVVTFPRVKLI